MFKKHGANHLGTARIERCGTGVSLNIEHSNDFVVMMDDQGVFFWFIFFYICIILL